MIYSSPVVYIEEEEEEQSLKASPRAAMGMMC